MVERGSAEPPSSLFVLLELDDERSVVTLPEALPPPGALTVPDALPPGTLTLPEALPLALGAAGALPEELDLSAGADDVALEDELDPGCWA